MSTSFVECLRRTDAKWQATQLLVAGLRAKGADVDRAEVAAAVFLGCQADG